MKDICIGVVTSVNEQRRYGHMRYDNRSVMFHANQACSITRGGNGEPVWTPCAVERPPRIRERIVFQLKSEPGKGFQAEVWAFEQHFNDAMGVRGSECAKQVGSGAAAVEVTFRPPRRRK